MVLADPEQVRQLLAANPQLAFALMEAMALLKMVHPSTVHVRACFAGTAQGRV